MMDNYPNSLNTNTAQNTSLCHSDLSCFNSRNVVLKCGCGSAGPLPISDLAGASIINPYAVASVSLNTKGLRNPRVLILFTCLINVPAGVLPNISFRVKKACGGASQAIGGSFNYTNAIDVLHSDSFGFQVCDCGECCDCATYTVEISNATLAQAGTMISGTVSVLAVDGGDC